MLYVSKAKYTAPEMDIVEFGNEDLVCVVSGWTPDGDKNNGFGVVEEDKDHPYTDGDF